MKYADISFFMFSFGVLIISFFVKEINKEAASLLSLLSGILVLKYGFNILESYIPNIEALFQNTDIYQYYDTLLKTFGISSVVKITSDSCRDLGENSLASKIETMGKIELFVISIPLFEKIMEISKQILS